MNRTTFTFLRFPWYRIMLFVSSCVKGNTSRYSGSFTLNNFIGFLMLRVSFVRSGYLFAPLLQANLINVNQPTYQDHSREVFSKAKGSNEMLIERGLTQQRN